MINISKTMNILGRKYPRSTTTLNTMRGNARKVKLFEDASLVGRLMPGRWWDASLVGACATGGIFYE